MNHSFGTKMVIDDFTPDKDNSNNAPVISEEDASSYKTYLEGIKESRNETSSKLSN